MDITTLFLIVSAVFYLSGTTLVEQITQEKIRFVYVKERIT
jgi:hypothetical protein